MAEKILMVALSPTMEEGRIVSWKIKPGEEIKSGSVLCEVETDKATMEYEAPKSGVLLKVLRQEGESVKVGEPIAWMGKAGEQLPAEEAPAGARKPAEETGPDSGPKHAPPPAQGNEGVAVPPRPEPKELGPAGGPRPAFSLEDKATQAIPYFTGAAIDEGKGAGVGGAPGTISPKSSKSSPLARKIAAELGIDVRAVPGSGPGGRVVKRDVIRFHRQGYGRGTFAVGFPQSQGYGGPVASEAQGAPVTPGATETGAPAQASLGVVADREIPVSGMRATIARRLSESFFTAPHFFLRVAVEMDPLMEARNRFNNEGRDSKLSLNAFIVKFAAEALKRHPQINSTWKGSTILIHGSIDIALAVALSDGLITPVVRDCGSKGIRQIDQELSILIEKAKKGGLKPEEYSNATFTISNLGSFGIEEFTAIINPPGSAILALGEVRKEPVVTEQEELVIRRVMRMTLSCDHRTIDGAVGAAFLRELKQMMEDPFRVLL